MWRLLFLFEVHPKVKVKARNQGEVLRPLKLKACCESSSQADSSSIAGINVNSPRSTVRIPDTYIPCMAMPTCDFKGSTKNDKDIDDEERQNIRVTSYYRPRAVLSSPENDGMIGKKNSTPKEYRSNDVKKHKLIQNRHAMCKISPTPCQVNAEQPSNSKRKLLAESAAASTDIKSDSKGKKTTGRTSTP